MTAWLTRVTLRRDPDVTALRPLIDPARRSEALDAHHRLIWTLFADGPDRRRDFLWRAEGAGRFHILSRRPPQQSALFGPPDAREFTPVLASGDRLRFLLRVNATVDGWKESERGPKRERHDIVMARLHGVPDRKALPVDAPSERAAVRMTMARDAAVDWMGAQGRRHGFVVPDLDVTDYSVMALPGYRGKREGQPQFGILDLAGKLVVKDPDRFVSKVVSGFGRAKAFGCGLMMIRRA